MASSSARTLHERRFHCMTTDIALFVNAEDESEAQAALGAAEAFFRSTEARFSRFRPDSELSRLNDSPCGPAVAISDDLAELLQLALQAARASGGIFDPTILDALEAAGYDRSIDLIRAGEGGQARTAGIAIRPPSGPAGLRLAGGPGNWSVRRPTGVRVDLGGIAKGWAADRAARLLQPLGPGLVDAGGDLRAWGSQPGADAHGGWLAAVDHPLSPGADVAWLRVCDGAAATSSITTRRWAGGHHLIDPRTGRPADTDLLGVTVLAGSTAGAEVAAKVALILGLEDGLAWLATQPGTEALLAAADGQFYGTPGVSEHFA